MKLRYHINYYNLFNIVLALESKKHSLFVTSYRCGFNGMERDDELKGSGNSYDFGARIYDSRLGRWWSLDPLMKKYSHYSNYIFTRNNPIIYCDVDGKEERYVVKILTDEGDVEMIHVVSATKVIFEIVETFNSVTCTSSDIVTTITVDLRTGTDIDKRYSIEKSEPLRNTGSAAVADQAAHFSAVAKEGLKKLFSSDGENTQEFGFVLVGGNGPGSNWINGLPEAKRKEILNIGSLLGAAGVFGYSGDLNEAIKKLNKGGELSKDLENVKVAVDMMVDIIDKKSKEIEKIKNIKEEVMDNSKAEASPNIKSDSVYRKYQVESDPINGDSFVIKKLPKGVTNAERGIEVERGRDKK